MCCFSAKYASFIRKSKDWLTRNRCPSGAIFCVHIRGLLFQWASTIKKFRKRYIHQLLNIPVHGKTSSNIHTLWIDKVKINIGESTSISKKFITLDFIHYNKMKINLFSSRYNWTIACVCYNIIVKVKSFKYVIENIF
jgi:superfamily II DNA or RNA helicase